MYTIYSVYYLHLPQSSANNGRTLVVAGVERFAGDSWFWGRGYLHYTELYCTAMQCSVLYCTALPCTAWNKSILSSSDPQCPAPHLLPQKGLVNNAKVGRLSTFTAVLYCTVLLHFTVLNCTVLYWCTTVLYCTVLYCWTVLYCTAELLYCYTDSKHLLLHSPSNWDISTQGPQSLLHKLKM